METKGRDERQDHQIVAIGAHVAHLVQGNLVVRVEQQRAIDRCIKLQIAADRIVVLRAKIEQGRDQFIRPVEMRPADGGSINERRRIHDDLRVHADFVASPVRRATRNRPRLLDRAEALLEIGKEREQVSAETAKRPLQKILGCIHASPKRVFPDIGDPGIAQ